MKITNRFASFASLILLLGCSAQIAHSETIANLNVSIFDESGSDVQSARLFIYSKDQQQFVGTQEVQGHTALNLPTGNYRIYAAMTSKTGGVVDHYASPEATVSITADEPTSVILSLQKAQDPDNLLSETALRKMGLDEKLVQYLN